MEMRSKTYKYKHSPTTGTGNRRSHGIGGAQALARAQSRRVPSPNLARVPNHIHRSSGVLAIQQRLLPIFQLCPTNHPMRLQTQLPLDRPDLRAMSPQTHRAKRHRTALSRRCFPPNLICLLIALCRLPVQASVVAILRVSVVNRVQSRVYHRRLNQAVDPVLAGSQVACQVSLRHCPQSLH